MDPGLLPSRQKGPIGVPPTNQGLPLTFGWKRVRISVKAKGRIHDINDAKRLACGRYFNPDNVRDAKHSGKSCSTCEAALSGNQ